MTNTKIELFHAIADAGSAKVRQYVVDASLESVVQFRNVAYAEVQSDMAERSIVGPPALWLDGAKVEGAEACIAQLKAWADVGRIA